MTGNHGQDVEEKSSASEGETETVGKPTGKAPDTQNVWDITETVTEEQMMEVLGHICLYAYMHKVNPNIFGYFL